jgi:regulator of sirC expression with transglutaminase-like and TPR domain
MVYLLDDPDERVVGEIRVQLVKMGQKILSYLDEEWPRIENPRAQDQVLSIIKEIKSRLICDELRTWKEGETHDLLDGALIIDKLHKPDIDKQIIDNKLDKIKLDAWLELNYDLTSFEKVKILNHVIFDMHKFKGDTENYHNAQNSFISHVLEAKSGNPVSLSIIYSIVAQRLNIPVYGVNLPQHFVLGYIKDFEWQPIKRLNDESVLTDQEGAEIMFYINPFNNGLIFSKENINQFLKQLNLEPQESYFKACSNVEIIKRMLRNLIIAYEKEQNNPKLSLVQEMLQILES